MSKLFFDLQDPALAARFRENREDVLKGYALGDKVKQAIRDNDVPFLAARTNAYLLRYYFFAAGMKDEEFIQRLRDG
jgi:hypothetical protein